MVGSYCERDICTPEMCIPVPHPSVALASSNSCGPQFCEQLIEMKNLINGNKSRTRAPNRFDYRKSHETKLCEKFRRTKYEYKLLEKNGSVRGYEI